MADEQIQVVYGGSARPAAESAVTRELRPIFNQANQITSFVESWTIAGDILPAEGQAATTANLRTNLDALIALFERPGLALKRQTTEGEIIDQIDPSECQWGPRLADVSFASGADSVLPVRLPFSIRMEAETRNSAQRQVNVLEFREDVQEVPEARAEWQGGRYFPGRLVPTKNFPGYVYRQQGRVLTLADSFIIPPPLFGYALIGEPQISEGSKRAVKSGNTWQHVGLEISWSYEMALPFRLRRARPHQWPGSTLGRF